jgi:hypothetical protein
VKNSPLSAFVLLGAATLIGGVAWFAIDDERIPTEVQVVTAVPEASGPRVTNLTPFEARKKGRLEAARREIEEYKKVGKILDNGAIKVMDDDGTPLYVHPDLIEGVGRYGEPLYAMAKYKRRPGVPLRDASQMPRPKAESAQPQVGRVKPGKSPINFGKKPDDERQPASAGGGTDSGGDDSQAGGKQPGQVKDG